MRNRALFAFILWAIPAAAFGEDDTRAMTLAKETLDRGATLFDTRDAKAMAATFLENAQLIFVRKPPDSEKFELETKSGRATIESAYDDLFKSRSPEHKARNTVESAKFLSPDLLLIKGRFSLNADQGDTIQFVQVRAREGDQWKVATMQLMELPR